MTVINDLPNIALATSYTNLVNKQNEAMDSRIPILLGDGCDFGNDLSLMKNIEIAQYTSIRRIAKYDTDENENESLSNVTLCLNIMKISTTVNEMIWKLLSMTNIAITAIIILVDHLFVLIRNMK